MTQAEPARRIVLVTGLSGAGKASIMRVLEDLGYETVDNPPLAVLEELVAEEGPGAGPLLAAGIDSRTRGFSPEGLLALLPRLRDLLGVSLELVYATADEAVLLRRFSETRRRHPLAPGGPLGARVIEGIEREAAMLAPLREAADLVIDTSELPLPDLRRQIESRYGAQGAGMTVSITSFAFPRGLPREADLVFDMRFLRNPHYDPALRPLTGRDRAVAEFIEKDTDFFTFWQRMTALLDPLLPRYAAEGKKYLTIAVGCTGGKHRSVLVAERLANYLSSQGWRTDLSHRELGSARPQGQAAAGNDAEETSLKGLEALTQTP